VVNIENKQHTIKINISKLREDAHHILGVLDYDDYDLGIWLMDNSSIQEYNKKYRHKDKPTDILSFAYYDKLKPGERIVPPTEDDKNLGDLMISLEYVHDEYKTDFYERVRRLLVHGICHLLGYDHETDAEYEVMKKMEDSLLEKLDNTN
jgi:probable rRNA maturation factor